MSVTDLQRARQEQGLQPNGDPPEGGFEEGALPPGRSFRERAQDHPDDEAGQPGEQGELFVLEQGRKVTLSQLIGRNTAIEYKVQMSGLTQHGAADMGLIAFNDPDVVLVVPARAGKVVTNPTYNEDGTVQKVTITAAIKPMAFYDSRSSMATAALGDE